MHKYLHTYKQTNKHTYIHTHNRRTFALWRWKPSWCGQGQQDLPHACCLTVALSLSLFDAVPWFVQGGWDMSILSVREHVPIKTTSWTGTAPYKHIIKQQQQRHHHHHHYHYHHHHHRVHPRIPMAIDTQREIINTTTNKADDEQRTTRKYKNEAKEVGRIKERRTRTRKPKNISENGK